MLETSFVHWLVWIYSKDNQNQSFN